MNMPFLPNHINTVFLYSFSICSFAVLLWRSSSRLLNMGILSQWPSQSALFSAYASISGSIMMIRSIANEVIPSTLQAKLHSYFEKFFRPISGTPQLTLVIKRYHNEVYDASESYLCTRITPSVDRVKVFKRPRDKKIGVALHEGEELTDEFQGIQLKWTLVSSQNKDKEDTSFHLEFPKVHYEKILESYLPHVIETVKAKEEEEKVIHLHRLNTGDSTVFEHPSNFSTLAMDEELKREIIEDLERFIERKEFYKRVGKAWKRGYLLYGPPGTGKSTLIAAIANHLKFDVYDLELANVKNGADLRKCLRAVDNQFNLVFEDIDCTISLHDRKDKVKNDKNQLTLSEVLNTIDGLWSSCGDERIIIFTTNNKDCLDPALLRPGRMDMQIHMTYCTADAFSTLALTYLGIAKNDQNKLYLETKDWISKCQVTAAQVAEKLMKSEDADIALGGLLEYLKQWRMEDKNELEAKRGKKIGSPISSTLRKKLQEKSACYDDDMVYWESDVELHVHKSGMCFDNINKIYFKPIDYKKGDLRPLYYRQSSSDFKLATTGVPGQSNIKLLKLKDWNRDAIYNVKSSDYKPGLINLFKDSFARIVRGEEQPVVLTPSSDM